MAIYHLSMKAIQRSAGRSAAASAAYRSGEAIYDPRQNLTWDYPRKERILGTALHFPEGSPPLSRQDLWGSVELHHKRGDAVTCREVEVALPAQGWNENEWMELADKMGTWLSATYGVAVDVAIHKSSGKLGNPHAHILMTSVAYGPTGLGKKVDGLDPIWCGRNSTPKPTDVVREKWASLVNKAFLEKGSLKRIDHRSLEAQGIDREPQIHVGNKVRSQAYKIRKQRNKEIVLNNLEITLARDELARLEKEIQEIRRKEQTPLPSPTPKPIQLAAKEPPKEDLMKVVVSKDQDEFVSTVVLGDDGKKLSESITPPGVTATAVEHLDSYRKAGHGVEVDPALEQELRTLPPLSRSGWGVLEEMARTLGVAGSGDLLRAVAKAQAKLDFGFEAEPDQDDLVRLVQQVERTAEAERASQGPTSPRKAPEQDRGSSR